jgi:hypothetical protein
MAAYGKYTHPKLKKALARRRSDGRARGTVEGKHTTGGEPPTPTDQLNSNHDESRQPGKG